MADSLTSRSASDTVLSRIPTRLALPREDVDLLIQSGTEAVLKHPTFKGAPARPLVPTREAAAQ